MHLACTRLLKFGVISLMMRQTQGSVTENEFSQLGGGNSFVGELIQKLATKSSLHCSIMCALDPKCFGYQYTEIENINCRVVQRNSVVGETFVTNETDIYLKVCRGSWAPPNNWTAEDQPTVYQSFDEENYCLELINGASIAPGKVSNAVKTNSSFHQWVSLGDLSGYTCFPKPSTCGPEGASLSVWIRIDECSSKAGIISSFSSSSSKGFVVQCQSGTLRYALRVYDGYFHYNYPWLTDWYHLALVYHGPNDGQGISIYHDGNLIKNDASKALRDREESRGTVVIGKLYTDTDQHYGSVMVDELTFWNKQLLPAEIQAIVAM